MAKDSFDKNFCDSTLRIDYIFGGTPAAPAVMLDRLSKSRDWAGRRTNLHKAPLKGNGSVTVTDPLTGDTLYINTFSSLFQEWLAMPESEEVSRSFENSFLVPLPRKEAVITLSLRDTRHKEMASSKFRYRPDDELVAVRTSSPIPHKYLHRGGSPDNAVDVAILAEGYTEREMDAFTEDAQRVVDEILSYEPFCDYKDNFNFVAVFSPSEESGVSVPLEGKWVDTAFGAHFSTFRSPRYLTPPDVRAMHDALQGIPYEHILMVVNTDRYGGGGIYNNYQIATARNQYTLPVAVHEFGHSFGGLADEYFYTGEENDTYPLEIEPWEPNITTMVDFDSKWKDMVGPSTPVPTPWEDAGGTREERLKQPPLKDESNTVGAYEGAGYRTHGIFRPVLTCRMRDNHHPSFCPVCTKALREVIEFYTGSER